MSALSLSYWKSDVYWIQNNKHFAELAPQNGGKQLIWRNYVTVTLSIGVVEKEQWSRERFAFVVEILAKEQPACPVSKRAQESAVTIRAWHRAELRGSPAFCGVHVASSAALLRLKISQSRTGVWHSELYTPQSGSIGTLSNPGEFKSYMRRVGNFEGSTVNPINFR